MRLCLHFRRNVRSPAFKRPGSWWQIHEKRVRHKMVQCIALKKLKIHCTPPHLIHRHTHTSALRRWMKRQHSLSIWVLLKRFIGMLLNILTFFLIRNALKMFQTLLIPTAIPHRCSLSCFIGLYLSICPPSTITYLFISYLMKAHATLRPPARAPSALSFPAAPTANF